MGADVYLEAERTGSGVACSSGRGGWGQGKEDGEDEESLSKSSGEATGDVGVPVKL